jgi:signal transduction histidine kinase
MDVTDTSQQDSQAWRFPRIRLRPSLILFGLFVGIGLAQAGAVRLALASEGAAVPWHAPFVWHLTGALAAWLALPIVQLAVINAPGTRVGWPRFVALHLAGYASFTGVHIATMMGFRWLVEALFELGTPERALEFRVLYEAQNDLVIYGGLAALWTLLHAWEERRATTLRAAQLEAQLASTRLEALAGQLDPHFLFNALNTVSQVMHEDLQRTERLLSGLGQLLRATLGPGGATWSFSEERMHTERYVELLQARLGDRLVVTWDIAPGLDRVRVPRFAIQMLVENAVKHNQDRREPLAVCVRCADQGGEMGIVVEDSGCGFSPAPRELERQRGLGRLEETLHLLHGARGRLERAVATLGGARVALTFPREEG